jgi:hypothetical protein
MAHRNCGKQRRRLFLGLKLSVALKEKARHCGGLLLLV